MAREQDPLRTVTVRVEMPHKMEHFLWQLVQTGLFGRTSAEAAERLIAEGLERRLGKDARSIDRPLLRDVL